MLFVVFGHLFVAVIDRGPEGQLRGANLVSLVPGLRWLGLASPMPVFFTAAGWAAAGPTAVLTGRPSLSTVRRVRGLAGTAFVIVALWGAVAVVEQSARGSRGSLTDGARLATQPLWFLAAYVPLVLLAPVVMPALRRPWLLVTGCALFVAVGDAARFMSGAPRWVGFPGFFAAWSIPFVIGWWWRTDRHTRRERERGIGVVLSVAGTIFCVVLVCWFGYSARLIDLVPGDRSNSTPPTLFTVAASLSQCGVFMIGASRMDVIAGRFVQGVKQIGAVAPGVYVWHLTALSLCAVPLLLGLPFPERLTTAWWLVRPVWFAAVLAVTWVLAKLSGLRSGRSRVIDGGTSIRLRVLVASSALAATGAGAIGLWGPTTPYRAVLSSGALGITWWLLRVGLSPS